MSIVYLIIAVICILAGLAMVVIPLLPGLVIIWLAILFYGLLEGWQSYGMTYLLISGALAAGGMLLDQLAGVLGAKKFGAGYPGMIGAFAGAIIGLIILNLPGLIAGTFLGAFAAELVFSRKLKASAYAGTGALLGFVSGALGKFLIGLIMAGSFIYLTVFPSTP